MNFNLLKSHPYKLSLLWALFIFILCATPGRYVPAISFLELLSFDKWVHAAVFFVLVSLLGIAVIVHHQNKNLFYFYVVLGIMYGGMLEIMQAKIFSERSADWYDMIANTAGSVIAFFLNKQLITRLFK
jgi:VanZ family protein